MIIFRLLAVGLPQSMLLLVLGAKLDLLGGWNQTSAAFHTLLLLFVLAPSVPLSLLITETVRFCIAFREMKRWDLLLWAGIALLLLGEALAIDLYLISQMRM